ncbi:MAG: hypothetical protein Q7Q71_09830 [Verrucomicrobiota bacterium JB023]|nr:hypothetical protein [Verrucomicrobiota bacterium JB023]
MLGLKRQIGAPGNTSYRIGLGARKTLHRQMGSANQAFATIFPI